MRALRSFSQHCFRHNLIWVQLWNFGCVLPEELYDATFVKKKCRNFISPFKIAVSLKVIRYFDTFLRLFHNEEQVKMSFFRGKSVVLLPTGETQNISI